MIPGLANPEPFSENRRRLHFAALDTLKAWERNGSPFVLVLRSFDFLQLFGETPLGDGAYTLEDQLFRDLKPLGIGLITVQEQGGFADLRFESSKYPHGFGLTAPSLLFDSAQWLEGVMELARRAQLIIIVFPLPSPGVLQELKGVAENGWADRSAVVLLESHLTDLPLCAKKLLTAYPRVVQGSELDPHRPLESFVWKDLIERLQRIVTASREGAVETPPPITWDGLARGYFQLAIRQRGRKHYANGVVSFERAARAARLASDPELMAECRDQQFTMLEQMAKHRSALAVLRRGERGLDELEVVHQASPASIRWARTSLAITRITSLRSSDPAAARAMIDQHLAIARGRQDARSESALLTELAWWYRSRRDAISSLGYGHQARDVARKAGFPVEAANALTVIGVLFRDIDEDDFAENSFQEALKAYPRPGQYHHEWLIHCKLADIALRRQDLPAAVRSFQEAIRVADELNLPAEARTAREALTRVQPPSA